MSKRNKKSEIVIKEGQNNKEDFTELELFIHKDKIGTVQQPKGAEVTLITKSGKEAKAKNVDEAVNQLIMDYNLHYM